MNFLQKQFNRFYYLKLIFLLNFGYFITWFLKIFIAPLLSKKKTKDLVIFCHSAKNSDGYQRRFEVFFKFLKDDNIEFDILTVCDDNDFKKKLLGESRIQFKLYTKIYFKRISQVLKARKYKSVFVQRCLFPYYPEQKKTHLEKLLRKLSNNITYDFWDPVHLWDKELTFDCFNYADQLCMDNKILYDYYSKYHEKSVMWPIAVDISKYSLKTDYSINNTVKLFYTGGPGNVKTNLQPLIPILEKLNTEIKIDLIIVGKYAPKSDKINIIHHEWDENSYFKLISECDLGLFSFYGNPDHNKWRVAGKTLDYLSSGLPLIGVKEGLPYGIDYNKHMFCVTDNNEWENVLMSALKNDKLRKEIGTAGRLFIQKNFSLNDSYIKFKNIIEPKTLKT